MANACVRGRPIAALRLIRRKRAYLLPKSLSERCVILRCAAWLGEQGCGCGLYETYSWQRCAVDF